MYDGEWENDRMTGFGTFWWPNGDHYEGEWKDGKFHGQVKYPNHWNKQKKKKKLFSYSFFISILFYVFVVFFSGIY